MPWHLYNSHQVEKIFVVPMSIVDDSTDKTRKVDILPISGFVSESGTKDSERLLS